MVTDLSFLVIKIIIGLAFANYINQKVVLRTKTL